ncbi:DUF1223 domain-containing protein [Chelativorans sp. Marseille-P2723]|uniref:DUF1223 domain-containing protein n=1 Tax=Chelativorans sp. Marseille-P2723 TaxID=2709133 RepID=UPI00156F13C5|nr:DUF1223 domain-containing protein [Chelativorans sp. Marseille-P2723]
MPVHFPRRSVLKASLAVLALPVLHGHARQETIGVVELFTSQGCTACPPADALLAELAQRDDLVTLSYHVDYWDYLGWKDELATAGNTDRQKAYGKALDNTVYTPQAIVNGQWNVVGSDRERLLKKLGETSGRLHVDLNLSAAAQSLFVDVGASDEPASAHVVLVHYRPQQMVTIRGGENRGKTIDYRNIVTDYRTLAIWNGRPLRLELPRSEFGGNSGCAVLLQDFRNGAPGPIRGAARISL